MARDEDKQRSGQRNLSEKQVLAGFGGKEAKKAAEQQNSSLAQLVETMKEQSGDVRTQVDTGYEMERSLKGIEGLMADSRLTEEQRRESIARQEEANELLESMAAKLDSLNLEQKDEGGGFFAGILGGLGSLAPAASIAISGLVALTASMTGLDDELRALKIAEVFKKFTTRISRFIANIKSLGGKALGFIDRIKAIKLPDLPKLPKVSFVDIDGKPYDFSKWKVKLPDLPRVAMPEMPKLRLPELPRIVVPEMPKLKLPEIPRITFPEIPKLKLPEGLTQSLDDVKAGVTKFFDGIPRIKFKFPEGLTGEGGIVSKLKGVFGSMDEGTGILGFIGKTFSMMEPLLTPFKKIIGVILKPFVQIFLSVIDFVTGFYDGFTSEEGSFGDKIKAGIEGGIKGVIKGITEAVDLLLVDLPAWFLEKLGFKGVADDLREFSLTELVDPAWESIKTFFKKAFEDPVGTFKEVTQFLRDLPKKFIKMLLGAILPPPDFMTIETPAVPLLGIDANKFNLNPIPDALYEFAGINPATGEKNISKLEDAIPALTAGAEIQDTSASNAAATAAAAMAAQAAQSGSVAVVGGDTNTSSAIVVESPILGSRAAMTFHPMYGLADNVR